MVSFSQMYQAFLPPFTGCYRKTRSGLGARSSRSHLKRWSGSWHQNGYWSTTTLPRSSYWPVMPHPMDSVLSYRTRDPMDRSNLSLTPLVRWEQPRKIIHSWRRRVWLLFSVWRDFTSTCLADDFLSFRTISHSNTSSRWPGNSYHGICSYSALGNTTWRLRLYDCLSTWRAARECRSVQPPSTAWYTLQHFPAIDELECWIGIVVRSATATVEDTELFSSDCSSD